MENTLFKNDEGKFHTKNMKIRYIVQNYKIDIDTVLIVSGDMGEEIKSDSKFEKKKRILKYSINCKKTFCI